MRAISIERTGGPEVLEERELPDPRPGPGEVLIRVAAVGVNFIDVYHRTGRYPLALPFTPGQEAAGVVEAVGEGVRDPVVGDRVAYANHLGSYAELAAVPAAKVVTLPEDLPFVQAAAVLLQGLTAHFLVTDTFSLRAGHVALVHAGAGGVGLLLTQMARRLGARVITTVSTEEKARLSREAGADEVILYTRDDFRDEVRRITAGEGVDVVYDSVGKTTFDRSLDCLKPRGMLVLLGASSGAVPPVDPLVLARKGSLFLTRPSIGHYVRTREELIARASDLFGWLLAGELRVHVDRTYPVREAARAHQDLESRATTGKLLLLPV